jgi:hypothetical protein
MPASPVDSSLSINDFPVAYFSSLYTEIEGPMRIRYKCLVTIYVFPAMKLCGSLFPKQNYDVLSPNFHIYL